jgi:hypothetical protein
VAEIIRSGAFLQQCWSVHPLCVAVKRMAENRTLILSCSSCRLVHHLAFTTIVAKASVGLSEPNHPSKNRAHAEEGLSQLAGCLETHAPALSLREMDVFEDRALIRCADCRRHYALTVSAFETHQR